MLPLWHREVLIMMPGGTERVPSDTGDDLNSCNAERVQIHTHYPRAMHTHTQSYSVQMTPLLTYRLVFTFYKDSRLIN